MTVVEKEDRVMSRVVSANISDYFQLKHTNEGVKLLLSTALQRFEGRRQVQRIITDNDQKLPASFVVVGVGVVPNTEIASAAGLDVDNGIVVDDTCLTTDPDIYAIGDCTSHPNAIYGQRLRLESVQNALEQAKTAASNICGQEAHYCEVPWFWSDQYDLKLQIAGLSQDHDDVVLRGEPSSGSFACFYLKEGVLVAVDAVNAPRDFVQAKSLIADRVQVDPARLGDPEVAVKDLA